MVDTQMQYGKTRHQLSQIITRGISQEYNLSADLAQSLRVR